MSEAIKDAITTIRGLQAVVMRMRARQPFVQYSDSMFDKSNEAVKRLEQALSAEPSSTEEHQSEAI